MRRALRILGYVSASLVGLVLVAYGIVYVVSEVKLRRSYAVTRRPIAIPHDSASIAEGGRLARIRGCTSCHGSMGEGKIMGDRWFIGRFAAPNLTNAVRVYSDTELEGIIRQGVRPNGRSVLGMPSDEFAPLTDQDLGDIVSYLRSLPVREGPAHGVRAGPLMRIALAAGRFQPAAVEARRAAQLTKSFPAPSDPNWAGAYLARTACSGCHGSDLKGKPDGTPPDLKIAGFYSLDAFTHLMRTGKAPGEREVGRMSRAAREQFINFTDTEIASLHRYLVTRARR